jgi:hypothetical protein
MHVDISAANLNDHLMFRDMVDGLARYVSRLAGRGRGR